MSEEQNAKDSVVCRLEDLINELEHIKALVEDSEYSEAMSELECQSGTIKTLHEFMNQSDKFIDGID